LAQLPSAASRVRPQFFLLKLFDIGGVLCSNPLRNRSTNSNKNYLPMKTMTKLSFVALAAVFGLAFAASAQDATQIAARLDQDRRDF
jgi:hypothetical protein